MKYITTRPISFSAAVLALLLLTTLMVGRTDAFMTATPGIQNRHNPSMTSMASSLMGSPRRSRMSFEDRMRKLVLPRRKQKQQPKQRSSSQAILPDNIQFVSSLDEYKTVVGGERERLVVVRFFASWCKACKVVQPLFYRLAQKHPNVLFVDVAVTEKNANLHQGLGIPSLPFAHIYSPQGGLVEELKITRPHFSDFSKKLQTYVKGACEIKEDDESSLAAANELSQDTATASS